MRAYLNRLVEGFGSLISLVFLVTVAITSYEVVMRYGFGAPTIWVHELSIALSVAAFAFGGPYAMASDAHLRIGALYDRGGRVVRLLGRGATIVSGVIYLAGLAYAFAVQSIESGWKFQDGVWAPETTGRAWDVPLPPLLRAIIAACCLLFLLQLIVQRSRK